MAHPLKFLFFNSRTSSSANAQEPFAWIARSDIVRQRNFSLEEIDLPSSTVLLSGGIDSSACLQFLLDRRHDVSALFIDHGQAAAERERPAAGAIAKHFDLHLSRWRRHSLESVHSSFLRACVILVRCKESAD